MVIIWKWCFNLNTKFQILFFLKIINFIFSFSAKIVFTTFLLKEIELLETLQSVDSKDELTIHGHAKTFHGILQLDVIENNSTNIVGILLCKTLISTRFNFSEELSGIIFDCIWNFGAEFSSMVISFSLWETDSEWHIFVDLFKVGFHWGEQICLWVFLYFSCFSSGSFMCGNIGFGWGGRSDIWEGSDLDGFSTGKQYCSDN